MLKKTTILITLLIPLFLITCCKSENSLKLSSGKKYSYTFTDGSTAEATFYNLSDNSLSFVKLKLENGNIYTLPQLVSASGARYTTGHNVEFWVKGNKATLSALNENGEWVILKSGFTK